MSWYFRLFGHNNNNIIIISSQCNIILELHLERIECAVYIDEALLKYGHEYPTADTLKRLTRTVINFDRARHDYVGLGNSWPK